MKKSPIIVANINSSSSSNTYNVTVYNDCFSCDCPAGGKGYFCKHIREVVLKNVEMLEAQAPSLLKKVLAFMELKDSNELTLDELKKECRKLIYLDAEISEKAAQNLCELEHGKLNRLEYEELFKKITDSFPKPVLFKLYMYLYNCIYTEKTIISRVFRRNRYFDLLIENNYFKIDSDIIDTNLFYEKVELERDYINKVLDEHQIKHNPNSTFKTLKNLLKENHCCDNDIKHYYLLSGFDEFVDSRKIYGFLVDKTRNND